MPNISILLIEDTEDISILIKDGLQNQGMRVIVAATGMHGLEYLATRKSPDLILLDLMLPDYNDFSLLTKIRSITNAPIIIISAKNTLRDKIHGIDIGADDYISKPFHFEELIVRIKAQLRRNTTKLSYNLKIGAWHLDKDQLQVFDCNGVSANLTPNEYRLLETLVSKPNKVFSREQLIERCRNGDTDISDRVIDIQLSRIRSKLKLNNESEQTFQAVRGVGYKYNDYANLCTKYR